MFKTNFKKLIKTKTFYNGVASIILAITGYVHGLLSFDSAAGIMSVALTGIFLRDAHAKTDEKIEQKLSNI